MGVGEAHRLHRAKAQRFAAAFGHHLDRQAAVEIPRRLALMELGLLGRQQRVDEGLVLGLGHRAIHVGGLFLDRLALVIARLHPGDGHVDALGIDDGGDGVEEGEALGAGLGPDRLCQSAGGEGAGGDDPMAILGQRGDLARLDPHQRMRPEPRGDGGGEGIPVHRQRAARGQAVGLGHRHQQSIRRPHFPVQQAHGIALVIIRAEGVGADHLGQIAGAMGEGADMGAHLVDDHGHAQFGRLPGGLGSGHAAADDVKLLCHGAGIAGVGAKEKSAGFLLAEISRGPGQRPGACQRGHRRGVHTPGPPWDIWKRQSGQGQAQSGGRLSRKAARPSSVSRQSMFSTITAPARS